MTFTIISKVDGGHVVPLQIQIKRILDELQTVLTAFRLEIAEMSLTVATLGRREQSLVQPHIFEVPVPLNGLCVALQEVTLGWVLLLVVEA